MNNTFENRYSTEERKTRSLDTVMNLRKENFRYYDVVSDCIDPTTDRHLVSPNDSTMTRYTAFRNNKIDYDADSSMEANVIYEKIFGKVINRLDKKVIRRQYDRENKYNKYGLKYELGEPDCTGGLSFRGDTMNSVATTNKAYYWDHKELHKSATGREFPWPKEALTFIDLYHTPGNFMPLPWREGISINQSRGTGTSRDFFDIFLMAIYNYFLEEDGKEPVNRIRLRHVLGNNDKLILFMKYFLLPFIEDDKRRFDNQPCQLVDDIEDGSNMICYVTPGWESFIDKYLLQDYTEKGHYGHYGKPKELWAGHFDSYDKNGNALPFREEQYLEFWRNASNLIIKRNDRIFDALHGL
ncbi:MAG: hypothetical protein K5888_00145 [Lachnospiraceae bacterium]|nr:hypothetical protein [Lachnospiraceae bacterium]